MHEDLVYLLLSGFAVYRLAIMIATDLGPFSIFQSLRYRVFRQFGDHWITDGFHCPSCVGFWLALIVGLIFGSSLFEVIIWWLGVAGMVTFMWHIEQVLSTPVEVEYESETDDNRG